MNYILIGKPGAGKGSLCKEFKEKINAFHVSTGDIFRNEIKNNTELGILANSYISKGNLCPDELTCNIIKNVLINNKDKNFLFDGFPRTLNQAIEFKKMLQEINLKIDEVVLLDCDDSLVVKRLSSRRVCRSCGAIYNILNHNPKVEGVCDECGGEVYTREDDKESSIIERLKVYNNQTKPLIDFYTNEGLLKVYDGTLDPDKLFDLITNSLSSLK